MALVLPPIPNDKIGETPTWRTWFFRLSQVGVTLAEYIHNSLTGLQGGTIGEYYHLTSSQNTSLIGGGDSALHYHSSDRNRANHTGTQLASTISDFQTTVSSNNDVRSNQVLLWLSM